MSIRLALLLSLLFGVLVAYLSSINATHVRISLGPGWAYELPVVALVVGAFLLGALVAFGLGTLRELTRSYQDYQLARRARRTESLSEIYHRGVDAQLAGKPAQAAEAFEEVLRREPGHVEAPIRLAELALQRKDVQAALGHHLRALRAEEQTDTLLAVAEDYLRLERPDDAIAIYRRILAHDRDHLTALRGLRDVAVGRERWEEGLEAQERLLQVAPRDGKAEEEGWLAGLQYELGRRLLAAGNAAAAITHFKEALRLQPDFVPAALALGDAHIKSGDAREALRVWERALELYPALPLLTRVEQQHRDEGRPTRMISVYEDAARRHPENLAVAFGLGRVYFELAMLDEAAEQFEKMEVRAPELPSIHAYLGAIFERRGQPREALEEYRRALRFTGSFDWPHRCVPCGAVHPHWVDRCPSCRRWNTSRP